jgi:HEAT repeat protein
MEAIKALASAKDPRALQYLLDALSHDDDTQVRSRAALSLSNFRDDRSAEALAGALEDDKSVVREAAAAALGHMGERRAVPFLVRLLQDPVAGVRTCAAFALRNLGWQASNAPEQALYEQAMSEHEATMRGCGAAVASLVQELNSDPELLRKPAPDKPVP